MQGASMGPPIYIGGNPLASQPARTARQRFNGATDLHRWKHDLPDQAMVATNKASMGPPIYIGGNMVSRTRRWWLPTKLQWGHRFTSVETGWTWTPEACVWSASMGPPIYIGGNRRRGRTPGMARFASMGPPIYIGGNEVLLMIA